MFAALLLLASSPNPLLADVISHRLARAPELADAEIDVTADETVVHLSGFVKDERAKEVAVSIAADVWSVVAVHQDLDVDAERAADNLEQVKGHLLVDRVALGAADLLDEERAHASWPHGWEIYHPDWQLVVEVNEGHVRMLGTVDSKKSLCSLIHLAKEMPGVRTVEVDLVALDDRWYDPYAYKAYYPLHGEAP